MTANQGPGVPAELLRNQLKLRLMDQILVRPVPDLTPVHSDWMDETVAALIDAVAASGHVIVDRDRMERLVAFGDRMFDEEFTDMDEGRNWRNAGLRPGDLEPVEPGAGR